MLHGIAMVMDIMNHPSGDLESGKVRILHKRTGYPIYRKRLCYAVGWIIGRGQGHHLIILLDTVYGKV